MDPAAKGDKVKVHYTGRLADGTVFDTSHERNEPLEFTLGQGAVIEGFEQAVLGLKPGQSRHVEIPPEAAYGPHRENMTTLVDRCQLPPDLDPQVGQHLEVSHANGNILLVTVTEVNDEMVRLDGNHPLAGKTLCFEIELLAIL
ncbi:peptidylprolyl isomerase [bacterium]|nr:peptidylprolyl isomerase [bacterium]